MLVPLNLLHVTAAAMSERLWERFELANYTLFQEAITLSGFSFAKNNLLTARALGMLIEWKVLSITWTLTQAVQNEGACIPAKPYKISVHFVPDHFLPFLPHLSTLYSCDLPR